MFAISNDFLQQDLSSYILSPIIGISLLSLFAGVIISLRQNRKLQNHRAVYFSAGPVSSPSFTPPSAQPESPGVKWQQGVNVHAADPAELTLLHSLHQCLPAGISSLNGLRAGDILKWEGGSAPNAGLARERIDSVLYSTRTGSPIGLILITDTRSIDPLLTSSLAATGLPVLHLEARRVWTTPQLAYMVQEGLGLTAAAA
jgi:hypothetical protein